MSKSKKGTPQRLTTRRQALQSTQSQIQVDDLALAYSAYSGQHLAQAYEFALVANQANERRVEVKQLLAIITLQQNNLLLSEDWINQAIQLSPTAVNNFQILGRIHKAQGQLEKAIAAYQQAIQLNPRFADGHVSIGIAYKLMGDFVSAENHYLMALKINPAMATARTNLANLQIEMSQQLGRSEGEGDWVKKNELLQRQALLADPDNPLILRNLASCLLLSGQNEEALELLNKALALDNTSEIICLDLGTLLQRMKRYESAAMVYERWLSLNRPATMIQINLSSCYHELGRVEDSIVLIDEVLAREPNMPHAICNLAHSLSQSLEIPKSLALFKQAIEIEPNIVEWHSCYLMTLNYFKEDAAHIAKEHATINQLYDKRNLSPTDFSVIPNKPTGRRLRIAYISADLRRHSVGYFCEPLFKHHNHEQFEVYGYFNLAYEDEVTLRLKQHANHWRACAYWSDEELYQKIRADEIDILIDLAVHTSGNRMNVIARKPAPIIINYLGYPETSGLRAYDFRISDHQIDPPQLIPFNSEAVLNMPHSMFCYGTDSDSQVQSLPALQRGAITFGSFNNLAKLSHATLSLWASVLHAVPNSRLFLKARSLSSSKNQQELIARFAALGIAFDRLILNPWQPDLKSHLDVYSQVDIGLDSYPFNGATTTCEALWMGVPVLSLCGQTHTSRMGASILTAAGLSDWICASGEELVQKAIAYSADLPALNAIRQQCRPNMQNGPLMSAAQFTQDFEQLLRHAWQIKLATSLSNSVQVV
ncbi:tetratricopeptide repeat protein [Ampullimonas aquatilis]|uniref:tetratricopeptide repeat protein n=1 Tax=Ampullimonas aquatilis TaxID=1341549 RepID=UPI003C77BAAE